MGYNNKISSKAEKEVSSFKKSIHPKEHHDAIMRHLYGPYENYVAEMIEKNTSLSNEARAFLITDYGITEANTVNKNPAKRQETKQSKEFKKQVKDVNSGTTKAKTSLVDADVKNWTSSASNVAKKASAYLQTPEDKNTDSTLVNELDDVLSRAGDVGQYVRANKSNYSDYTKTYEEFTEIKNRLDDLKKVVDNDNKKRSGKADSDEFGDNYISELAEYLKQKNSQYAELTPNLIPDEILGVDLSGNNGIIKPEKSGASGGKVDSEPNPENDKSVSFNNASGKGTSDSSLTSIIEKTKDWFSSTFGVAATVSSDYKALSLENFFVGFDKGLSLNKEYRGNYKPIEFISEFSADHKVIDTKAGIKVNFNEKSGFKLSFGVGKLSFESAHKDNFFELIMEPNKIGITVSNEVNWKNYYVGEYVSYYFRPLNISLAFASVVCIVSAIYVTKGAILPYLIPV